MATTSPRQAAIPILQLYRSVLKLHRERLPPPMRDLGDSLARAEFRNHLRGKTTQQQWQQFVEQWQVYVATLRGEETPSAGPGAAPQIGAEMVSGVYDSLSPDQRKRMELLKEEINRRGQPGES